MRAFIETLNCWWVPQDLLSFFFFFSPTLRLVVKGIFETRNQFMLNLIRRLSKYKTWVIN